MNRVHGTGGALIGKLVRRIPSEFYEWRSQAELASECQSQSPC